MISSLYTPPPPQIQRSSKRKGRKESDSPENRSRPRRDDQSHEEVLSPAEIAVSQAVTDVAARQDIISKDAKSLRAEVAEEREERMRVREELSEKEKAIAEQLAKAKQYADEAEQARIDARRSEETAKSLRDEIARKEKAKQEAARGLC